MKYLRTIKEIDGYIKTKRNYPVIVTCEDNDHYICKHRYIGSAKILFNEYIASSFLKIWNIKTPEPVFINVLPEHFKECIDNGLQPYYFHKTCFGSSLIDGAIDLEDFISFIERRFIRILKEDYLKIALFDFWMANEDRNCNNSNLMIKIHKRSWDLYAIDHEKCFNSNSGLPVSQLNYDENILAHDLFKNIFRKKKSIKDIVNDICNGFDINITNCRECLDDIIKFVPEDWELNLMQIKDFLLSNIFTDNWIAETKKIFKYCFYYYYGKL